MKKRNRVFFGLMAMGILLLASGCSFTSSELKSGTGSDKDAQISRMQSVIDDQNAQLRQLNEELAGYKNTKTENLK